MEFLLQGLVLNIESHERVTYANLQPCKVDGIERGSTPADSIYFALLIEVSSIRACIEFELMRDNYGGTD